MSPNGNSHSARNLPESSVQHEPVVVSLDVVWAGSASKHDARMSEISMTGCFIDSRVQGRTIGETVDFKVHLPGGPWVSLQGKLVQEDYPMGFELRFVKLTEADTQLLAQVVLAHGGTPGICTREASATPELQDTEQLRERQTGETNLGHAGEFKECQAVQTPALARRRVLIAEDDPLTLRMLSAIVKSEGYEVVSVADGREALRTLQGDSAFCAAIFDMSMPHLKGLDLILYMKADERLRLIPVGMVTAEQDPKVWDDSVAAGASVFLPKPFAPPQVVMLLRMLASKTS
jgi:two-component system cell cycle response regulator DivK